MANNIFAGINQKIDIKIAALIASKHGYRMEMRTAEPEPPPPPPEPKKADPFEPDLKKPRNFDKPVVREVKLTKSQRLAAEAAAAAAAAAPPVPPPPRVKKKKSKKDKKKGKKGAVAPVAIGGTKPPVVTFLGHVDHGKTTLLDYFRDSRVAHGEAGGITQHIGAYTINKEHNGETRQITFLDTPGHAAFSKMRARGASLTDIAVIVIAADDGIMPQTEEAIRHVKEAGVTMMVAINKCDLPAANPDRVMQQLQARELTPTEWGGEIETIKVSGKTGDGLEELLDLILLQAEVLELEVEEGAETSGIVIEAQMEPGMGPMATVLITSGVLHRNDAIVIGNHAGKVKKMIGDRGDVEAASPAHAVRILGLNGVPEAGSVIQIVASEKLAKKIAAERQEEIRQQALKAPSKPMDLAMLLDMKKAEEDKNFSVLVKADVQGSLEAIRDSLNDIKSDKVGVKFIGLEVGTVTENDIILAEASGAEVVAFHTPVDGKAVKAAKREGVPIHSFDIIYQLIDHVTAGMAAMLEPEKKETVVGQAECRQVFRLNKAPNVAGCVVIKGRVLRGAHARVRRKKDIVHDHGKVSTLRRFKDEVKEVGNGQECGIGLESFDEFSDGDIIEIFTVEEVAQSFDLLRQRSAAYRARLHDDSRRRVDPLPPHERRADALSHRRRRTRPEGAAGGAEAWPRTAAARRRDGGAFPRTGEACGRVERRLHPHHRTASHQGGATAAADLV